MRHFSQPLTTTSSTASRTDTCSCRRTMRSCTRPPVNGVSSPRTMYTTRSAPRPHHQMIARQRSQRSGPSGASETSQPGLREFHQSFVTDASAIRLRYNLPIVLPHSAVLAPPTLPDGKPIPRAVSSSVKKKDAPRIDFDPLLVAKHDPEGENMLKGLLAIWVSEAEREVMGSPRDGVKEVKEENDE